MIDHKKAQIIARTLGTLSNMSAHIIVAGYFKHMTKDEAQIKEWEEKIEQANQARDAAIAVIADMITDIRVQPTNEKSNQKESAERQNQGSPQEP